MKNVWRIQLLLGVLILLGLLSALLGTRYWYWIAWIAMAVPITTVIWRIKRSSV